VIVTAQAPVRVDFGGGWTDVDMFAQGAGGIVVNATIDKYVTGRLEVLETGEDAAAREGLNVAYGFDLPSGSGLGTSSAMNVVWLSLIKSRIATDEDRKQLAELAYQLETILGILGGKQDQYAAALGGFNHMTFGADGVGVERIGVSPETVARLEGRSVLCYTGKPRLSGAIHENVWGAFRQGNPNTVQALYTLREVAEQMTPALRAGDLETFAALMARNWEAQKALDPSVTNAQIDGLFEAARAAGALGGKACGAGGGGCLLFVTRPGAQQAVAETLARHGARLIPFRFSFDGLTLSVEP